MWKQSEGWLYRKFQFKDFSEAFSFLANIALISESINHHPTIINTYNKVEIRLTTHDAGNIVTDKDWQLAQHIDKLWDSQFQLA